MRHIHLCIVTRPTVQDHYTQGGENLPPLQAGVCIVRLLAGLYCVLYVLYLYSVLIRIVYYPTLAFPSVGAKDPLRCWPEQYDPEQDSRQWANAMSWAGTVGFHALKRYDPS